MNHDYFNWSSRDWEQSLDWVTILRLYTRNTDIWRILKTKTNIKIDTKWLLEFVRKLRIMEILSFSFSHHLQRTLIIYNSTNQATFPYINFCIHLARINPINSRIYERSVQRIKTRHYNWYSKIQNRPSVATFRKVKRCL